MILDLHTHSIKSDDGKAKVENYCQWIRKRGLELDGFVLTEHRQFDDESDYRKLEDEHGIPIMKASEVETDYGHVLVFGVNEDLRNAFDFTRIDLPLEEVLRESHRCGAVAVPCHPGRTRVGMCAHIEARGAVPGVRVIEVLNGGSREGEDDASLKLARERGYLGIGGSDSHIVSHLGRCATKFESDIHNIDELVDALRGDAFEAISWR
jgi:histidinol phosphatase-like PHP family hydrolase